MNTEKKIVILLTFFLVISFFYETVTFSNYHVLQLYTSEISTNENTIDPTLFSELDFIEDIQLTKKEHYNKYIAGDQTKVFFKKTLFLLLYPTFIIWQPPKLI